MPFCFWPGIGSQPWTDAWPFVVLWFVFGIVVCASIVIAIAYGVRRLGRQTEHGAPTTPQETLKARYARGELTRQDFEAMRRDLAG